MNKRNWVIPLIITVAAGVGITISLQTNTGASLVQDVKDIFASEKEIIQSTDVRDVDVTQSTEGQDEETKFEKEAVSSEQRIKDSYVPEKEVILSLEGQNEKIKVQLNVGTDEAYLIYIDEERYKMVKGEESDLITTINPLPEQYPDVSFEIKQVPDVKPEVLVEQYEAELKKDFSELRAIEAVTEPVSGYLLNGINGNQADSVVVHAYVISNGKEGSFIITEYYFLEAEEGHGARFHQMLESFEIVEL